MLAMIMMLQAAGISSSPAAFAICSGCHAVQQNGQAGIGPNLFGIVGRRSGKLAGYSYSSAMARSNLRWDSKTLDAFLAAPQKVVPGSKMPFSGEPDAAKRAAIIKYLQRLR